ncbi:winged helix-turn-helix transcriptional regulator [Methanoplanus limicola]|uniref:Transcriptional regulator, MarR family n=2 Tax=Methanoplanus limicola TaxID=2315 RepID=H1Z3G4_9EURY|nr:winged helix-turn-helix transcriptional regulator [Methanoplanus limicola]EHQ34759.1 transcriptional regulator, MarR family [Methanoplanus limicola DSM 2279]
MMDLHQKLVIFFLLTALLCIYPGCCEYTVTFGESNSPDADISGADKSTTFRELPLWIKISYVASIIAGFFAIVKFLPPIVGRIRYVLANEKRKEIMDYISANPGKSVGQLAEELNTKRETIRYHLNRLEKNNHIVSEKDSNSKRIFINQNRFTGPERRIIALCHNPVKARIVAIILKYPGIKNSELKEELNISKSAVTWHIKKLDGADLLSTRISGKFRHYHIRSEFETLFIENLPDEIKDEYNLKANNQEDK